MCTANKERSVVYQTNKEERFIRLTKMITIKKKGGGRVGGRGRDGGRGRGKEGERERGSGRHALQVHQ